MPHVSVDVNGTRVATISLTDLEMVNVAIFAALDSDPKARLTAFGGNYAPGDCGHLVWLAERAFLPGDVLTVRLHHHGERGDRGQTIDELYFADEPGSGADRSMSDEVNPDEVVRDSAARPRLHDTFMARVETSSGQLVQAASDDHDTDLQFFFAWHRMWPEQARVLLSTYGLPEGLTERSWTEHLNTLLACEDSVAFVLVE